MGNSIHSLSLIKRRHWGGREGGRGGRNYIFYDDNVGMVGYKGHRITIIINLKGDKQNKRLMGKRRRI